MKTFEQEYKELINWMKKKNQEDIEAHKKDTNNGIKDGILTYNHAQDVKEYNRRLTELKIKYGKDTDSVSTMTQESTITKAKKIHA